MTELITDTNRSPASAHAKEDFKNQQIECSSCARTNGVDKRELCIASGRIKHAEQIERIQQ
jgi:hypothetical protein